MLWPFKPKPQPAAEKARPIKSRIGVSVEKRADGREWLFVAIHNADVELDFPNGERVALCDASLDLYIGAIKPDIFANVYAMGDGQEDDASSEDRSKKSYSAIIARDGKHYGHIRVIAT